MKRVLAMVALCWLGILAWGPAQAPVRPPTPSDVARARANAVVLPRRTFSLNFSYYGVGYWSPYPVWGWGRSYGFTAITYTPSVVVAPSPVIVLPPPAEAEAPARAPDPVIADALVIRPRQPEPPQPPEPPLPGEAAGVFRPIDPRNREQARQPIVPGAPPAGEPGPPPVRPMLPDPDPKTEYARLLTLGRDSFILQEYGRAARRFRQATQVLPKEPLAWFLLAQAEFALGKYHEAVVSIHEGVRRQPDWPMLRFRPIDLYGVNAADFSEHLKRLDEALAQNPNDAALLFLLGYQLWFEGKVDQARPLLERAARLADDPSVIERFLNRRPPPPNLVVTR
jgi:hypothetical protein